MAGELIVGYDGSDCAKAALAQAADLARGSGTRVVIGFAAAPPAPGAEVSDHRRALEELGRRYLGEAAGLVDGVETVTEVVGERPAEALLHLAERYDARMIVLGTHGETPLVGAILGSVPHKLLHLSKLPVLVVPEPG
jgi:nucleotide-binding universal stress UspA family protein